MRHSLLDEVKDRLQLAVAGVLTRGAQAARILFQHSENITCAFEAGRLKNTGSGENVSCTFEVIRDGRRAQAYGNRIDEIEAQGDRALALVATGSACHFTDYPAPRPFAAVRRHDPKTLEMKREDLIRDCGHIVKRLASYNDGMWIGCSAERSESESLLISSGGVCHENRRTQWSVYSSIQRTENNNILFAEAGRSWCARNAYYAPDALANRILENLHRAEHNDAPPAGEVRVILPPTLFARMIHALLPGINGRSVVKGESPLANRLNERVLDPSLTIVDDPHRDFAPGARAIDPEGAPTRTQTLFEKGVLRRFLYDLDTAGLAGTRPTGNMHCQPYYPVVLAGERHSDELIARVDDGLYLVELLGFGQSNIINGDFSANIALGFRIRNGEITGRVKDTMISGNLYEIFGANLEISADLNHEGRFPYALVQGIRISA